MPVDRFVNPAQWQKQLFLASNSHRTDTPSETGPTGQLCFEPQERCSMMR